MKKLAFLALGATLMSGAALASVKYQNLTTTGYYLPAGAGKTEVEDVRLAGGPSEINIVQLAYYTGATDNPTYGTDMTMKLTLWNDPFQNGNGTGALGDISKLVEVNYGGLAYGPNPSTGGRGYAYIFLMPALTACPEFSGIGWNYSRNGVGAYTAALAATIGSSDDGWYEDANGDDIMEGWWWYGGTPAGNFYAKAGRVGPAAIRIIQGADENGGIAELFNDDNAAFSLFNDSETLFAIFEVDVDTFSLAPTSLNFSFKYEVGRGGLAYNYKLFNFTTNAFVTIGGNVAATTWESVAYTNTTNADDFVDPNGLVTARFSFGPINDEAPAQDGWLHEMEYVNAWAQ